MTIETVRLTLRHWTLDDAPVICAIYGDHETMRLFGAGTTFSPAEVAASLGTVITEYAEPGFGNYAVIEKSTGSILGHCGVHRVSKPPIEFEADWLIRRDRWGRGYATEAAAAVFQRVFLHGRVASIHGVARSDNAASIAVMRKLGMQYFGSELRFGFDSVIYVAASPFDSAQGDTASTPLRVTRGQGDTATPSVKFPMSMLVTNVPLG
jgi:RimJ/RimL family protein N-acetyltransferase